MRKILFVALCFAAACSPKTEQTAVEPEAHSASDSLLLHPEEMKYLKNIKQLTFGGNNAEAYWSFDDSMLVFQSDFSGWGNECDQIFYTNWQTDDLKNNAPKKISTGLGRTTCSYFLPGDKTFVYASTHLGGEACPPVPERRTDGKYVWPIYDSFDIFTADLEGTILNQLTSEPGYDAEATVSPKGDKIIFTSMRTGDLELYTMNIDGTDVKQITSELGYDGGAFFSPDGTKLVWRASRPQTEEEKQEYKDLLKEGLVMPTQMELYVANADGTDIRKITSLGKANWAPFFHPSGEKLIFASNHQTERGFPFNLFMINLDGTGLTRITHDGTFDAFPVFSNNGKYIVFASNRNNGGTRDTNLFVAEWIGD
ncbi:WD40 repeat protein [Algoriphagus boseongensis]|uniref:WD40 repeat protein n=1 Tax=Algoriphagus boseongensis TaxID=1442587 RepID=A0A4R6T5R4_9BACT|nr:PD40 domain-containing protein [Algoriphagus boseongensis]TDQ16992.1 WD40 repeat protein [Algoriphagus boseongensis]